MAAGRAPDPSTPLTVSVPTDTPDWQMPPLDGLTTPAWRDSFFATQLAKATAQLLWGVPLEQVHPKVRAAVRAHADTFTEDVIERYALHPVEK